MPFYKIALKTAMISILGWGLAACQDSGNNNPVDMRANSDLAQLDMTMPMPKGVYTMTNDVSDNQIAAYSRAADGTLTPLNSYSTGGKGTGAGLGNQNGLVFDSLQNLFYVVNAGDNTISMLSLQSNGTLALQSKVYSGGIKPVSITVSGNVVYVVNAGDNFTAANISGYQVSQNRLNPIANSSKALSVALPGPAQIQFNANGTMLVVTEKMTSKIDTFTVAAGVPTGPLVLTSNGMTPFGFAFSSGGHLIVTEAGPGAASSYSIGAAGNLTSISATVTSGQMAPCWAAVVRDTVYVTNAMSNNITTYKVGTTGALTLGSATAATTGMGPIDLDATDANDLLYVLNSKDHSFSIFSIAADGSLTKKSDYANLPMYANGLVAR